MPKLKDRPPKYCKMNGQAVVYYQGRPHYLGRHGTPESKTRLVTPYHLHAG